ncbi:YgiQ family radical SAM protein [Candidatus Auribacterota bacterium]
MKKDFLPITKNDLKERKWRELDIILLSADAYVDHPSYGVAIIGRVLENNGFRVGIIAQPDWKKKDDFLRLGKPKLFFGITAGNLDSMVANYTANKRLRKEDEYSPAGKIGLRPDRASIVYTNRIKEFFPGVPVILGGIEASLRRLAHYDYWSNSVRRSILLDSKADLLVYGMGERQVVAIAERLKGGESLNDINISGTVVVKKSLEQLNNYTQIPSFEGVREDKKAFSLAFKAIYEEADPHRGKIIVQAHDKRFVIQYPPAKPLSSKELDHIYDLPYLRSWHSIYDKKGKITGLETVRFSVVGHRGCCAECSFCSIGFHQGRIIQSRSEASIKNEIYQIVQKKDFKGTITDVGGPTANLYRADCKLWQKKGACQHKNCLFPQKCKNLKLGYEETIQLWRALKKDKKIKHLFIGSGLRYELLLDKASENYLKELCLYHISGQLKVAPEHTDEIVLKAMRKPPFSQYEKFVDKFRAMNQKLGKKQYLVNYFICSHPGSGLKEALKLSLKLKKRKIHPEQVQDFIPLPMTMASCMYYTGKDPLTGQKLAVANTFRERKMQRAFAQYKQKKSKKWIFEALKELNRS